MFRNGDLCHSMALLYNGESDVFNDGMGINGGTTSLGIRIRNIDWATQFFGESPVQTC